MKEYHDKLEEMLGTRLEQILEKRQEEQTVHTGIEDSSLMQGNLKKPSMKKSKKGKKKKKSEKKSVKKKRISWRLGTQKRLMT